MATEPKPKASGGGDDSAQEDGAPESKLSFVLGWIVLPGTVAFALFALGAYVGVHHPDSWITRLVRWLFG